MVAAKDALRSLFQGIPVVGDLVKNFDFSKMDTKDNTRQDYLTVGLAPAYGSLTSDTIKKMDDSLKIMMVGTVKKLASIPPRERTWGKVVSTMMQNPLLEPTSQAAVTRHDSLMKRGTNVFKFDGSPSAPIVKEVEAWFQKLISDLNVMKATQIDIDVLAKIVAQTGATVDSFEHFFYRDESHEKTIVDIGVLRFPDLDNPYFQVYRIKLTAWSESKRVLMVQDDTNGITGEYDSRNFKPRDSVIEGLKKETHDAAVDEADDILNG